MRVLFPSSHFVVHWLVDLLVFVIVVVVITTVVANFVDFRCYPSSFHICFPLLVGALQPLETQYHAPSWSFAFVLSSIYRVEMTFVVYQHSTYLPIPMLALQMVPLSFSSSFKPLPMCSPSHFWPLILRLHLPHLCSSSLKHSLKILQQFFFCIPMLPASPLWFSWPWFMVFVDCSFVEILF